MKLIKLCTMSNYEKECLFYHYGVSVYGTSIKESDLKKIYLEWWNNFLSPERFASYNSISEKLAKKIISEGRKLFA